MPAIFLISTIAIIIATNTVYLLNKNNTSSFRQFFKKTLSLTTALTLLIAPFIWKADDLVFVLANFIVLADLINTFDRIHGIIFAILSFIIYTTLSTQSLIAQQAVFGQYLDLIMQSILLISNYFFFTMFSSGIKCFTTNHKFSNNTDKDTLLMPLIEHLLKNLKELTEQNTNPLAKNLYNHIKTLTQSKNKKLLINEISSITTTLQNIYNVSNKDHIMSKQPKLKIHINAATLNNHDYQALFIFWQTILEIYLNSLKYAPNTEAALFINKNNARFVLRSTLVSSLQFIKKINDDNPFTIEYIENTIKHLLSKNKIIINQSSIITGKYTIEVILK